jgi:DNA-binding YbaB/EbfC family protein
MSDNHDLPERVEPDAVSDFEHDPLGALGGVDMGSILDVAQSMQAQMMEAQAKLASSVVEGQAGGGVVRIEVTGQVEFRSVHIDPTAFDPDDPSLLEDLVLAALHDAIAKLNDLQQETSPLGGLDLGDLGNMFGGGQG